MKTPSTLLLLPFLLAARPASAEIKAGDRCDTAFLEKVAKDYSGIGSVLDERIKELDRTIRIDAGRSEVVKRGALAAGDLKICDSGTWKPLVSGTPPVWTNADAQKHWSEAGAKENAQLALVVSDFYRAIDGKAAEALAAADEAIAAAVALGVASSAAPDQPVKDFFKANSGGRLAAQAPAAVSVKDKPAGGTVTKATATAMLRKLMEDDGTPLGSSVIKFRVAVMELAALVAFQARSTGNVKTRLGAEYRGLRDHIAGVPGGFSSPAKADAAAARDKDKYGRALSSLVGDGTTTLVSAEPRASAALDKIDVGLRNALAVRSAQLDAMAVAAKALLAGKTISQIELVNRADATAADKAPNNALAAEVLRRMTETPEYRRLDEIYENKKNQPGWAEKEGAEIVAARKRLQDAALSAQIETAQDGTKRIVYTQGERKYTLDGFVPEQVENDAATRTDVAAMIARMVVGEEQGNPKFAALVAAIKPPGEDPAPSNPREREAARDLPQASKDVKAGAQGCSRPGDIVDNDHEIYAARQRAAAAELTTTNRNSRKAVETKRDADIAANDLVCRQAVVDAAAIKKNNDFESDELLASRRAAAKKKAEEECVSRRNKIVSDAAAALSAIDVSEQTRSEASILAEADAKLAVSFRVAVDTSVDRLRREYVDASSSRHSSLIRKAKLSSSSEPLIGFVNVWFDQNWPAGEGRKGAINACAEKLGLGPTIAGKKNPTYSNPEDPDKVADKCGIHEDLAKFVESKKGSIH